MRGFRQFARDLDAAWARRASQTEGVVDAEGQSIDMVTIHSSKGLEWPVVIPINMASTPRSLESFVHRRTDDTLHWMLGDIIPPTLAGALQSEGQEEAQQRLRLLYVACTRAMDLLVLPELSWSDAAAWARTVDFRLSVVPELNIAAFRKKPFVKAHESRTPKQHKCSRKNGLHLMLLLNASPGSTPAKRIRTSCSLRCHRLPRGSNRSMRWR